MPGAEWYARLVPPDPVPPGLPAGWTPDESVAATLNAAVDVISADQSLDTRGAPADAGTDQAVSLACGFGEASPAEKAAFGLKVDSSLATFRFASPPPVVKGTRLRYKAPGESRPRYYVAQLRPDNVQQLNLVWVVYATLTSSA